MSEDESLIEWGKDVLLVESEALRNAAEKLSTSFSESVKLIQSVPGRLIVTGLGKSGHIGAKIASTMASTGTPSFFLHASEAMHGDFGILTKDDCLLAITYGGETREVLAVARYAKNHNIPVIALTGKKNSSLTKVADCVLDGSITKEADSLGLAPTASSTLALAIGDALAVALMRRREFTHEHFAKLHPGGDLGRRLSYVDELMRSINDISLVGLHNDFHSVLKAVGSPNFGVVAVVDDNRQLLGCVTDGDVRRALLEHGGNALDRCARDLMTSNPKIIEPKARVMDAISLMEEYKITSLFVVDSHNKKLHGLVRLHDLLSAKVI